MIYLSRPNISPEAISDAASVLGSGQIDPGPVAEDFRCRLAEFWGVPDEWVILTNSCTTAMGAAFHYFGKGERAPAFTWPGTYCERGDIGGLLDSFADGWVDPGEQQPASLTVVNLYGEHDPDLSRYDDGILLDSAHCLGLFDLKDLIDSGEIFGAAFSFGPTKEITTLRGGALVTPRAQELQDYLRYGTRNRWPMGCEGVNGTITEVGAMIGMDGLETWSDDILKRAAILEQYGRAVQNMEGVYLLTSHEKHSGHLAVLWFETPELRNNAGKALSEAAIQSSVHYKLPPMADRWPVAYSLSQRVLSVPCHLELTYEDVKKVCSVLEGLS
jgi:dTDP-4-amino-4,6-dideoxygalactose transaminase